MSKYGRPLPMLCVWTQDPTNDRHKCRACVCGNFAGKDPTEQLWTAQAEPSSLLAALKLGRTKNWTASKHDVKGAFMYTPLPEGKLVIVRPPEMWVQWGLVPAGTCWTLEKAVYGLRESPALWSKTRDTELADMTWMVGKRTFRLQRCSSDSQVWILREDHPDRPELLGLLVVYVDDFLLQIQPGEMRDKFLKTLADIWTLSKNETLTVEHPLTFLGIEIELRANGDAFIHQQTFTESILAKHNMSKGSGNTCV